MDAKKANVFFIIVVLLITPFALRHYENRPFTDWVGGVPTRDAACAGSRPTSVSKILAKEGNLPPTFDFDKEVERTIKENNLPDNMLFPFQCISITRYPVRLRWVRHVLQEGEYPFSIAKEMKKPKNLRDKYGIEQLTNMILAINGLTEKSAPNMKPGTVIYIPEFEL